MGYNLFIIEISRYFAQILKQRCNNTGKRDTYNLHSNEFHSLVDDFSFSEKILLVLW